MKPPKFYRKFNYDKSLLPNKYLASMEQGVSTIEEAKAKTGLSIGYPGWCLIYYALLSHLNPEGNNLIVETGTNQGWTTIILAQALKDSNGRGKIYTVELDQENYKIALANFQKAGVAELISAINGDSKIALKEIVNKYDSVNVAFLDASHLFDDVIAEFEIILPALGPQSLVVFDNTYSIAEEHEDQRVNGALKEILKRHGGNLVNLEFVSWYTPGVAIWQKSPFDSLKTIEANSISKHANNITPESDSKKSQKDMMKHSQEELKLWEILKKLFSMVEYSDFKRALECIALIDKQIIGRHCGDLGDKLSQYLAIIQFFRKSGLEGADSIEIGTLFGGSCLIKLMAMRDLNVGGKIICIDPMEGYYGNKVDPYSGLEVKTDILFNNLDIFGFSKEAIELKRMPSNENQATAGLVEGAYATLMIDGDHSYQGVRYDWDQYNNFVSKEGFILLDDYAEPAWPDITKFVIELIGTLPRDWDVIGQIGTTFLLKKNTNSIEVDLLANHRRTFLPEEVISDSKALLARYKDKHRGQRCVIIGNGPSLNKMDLSFLKDEITFGMNRIYLMFDKYNFRPTYYVSVNPLVIEQSVENILKIQAQKFLAFNALPYVQDPRGIAFLKSVGRPSFSKDPTNGLWEGYTVTYVAMQLAYFMGFSEVILIGVDHHFTTPGQPNQEVISGGNDPNHFHPDYFGKGTRWNLPDLKNSEIAYRLARKTFEADSRRIIDATVDGKLTIFPKEDYKDLFKKYRKIDLEKKGQLVEISFLNKQGEDQFNKGEIEAAYNTFVKVLERAPNFATAHNNFGVLCYSQGNKDKALSHYQEAARLQPENITFQKNLADFYYVELGRVEKAMQIYIKVLNANPEDIESLLILGHICVALKKFDDAKDFYARILIIEPWNKDAKQFFQKLEEYQLSVTGVRLGSENIETTSKGYLVSAIVSAYNSERFIRGCLEDLENQTIATRLEIVVVNSGSQENEEAIIKEFQEKYSNIKYIKTDKRETVYAAWNRGIKAATGKYITNANTDDRHRKDAFEVIINMLEQRPEIALVYADVIITETENETFENCTPVGYFSWMNWKREDLLNKGCFMGPQPMWRRDVHDEYGYFDDSLVTSGDYEFWLRISQTNTFLHLPIQLGLYFRSPGSIEHLNREKQREENNKIFKMYSKSNFSGKNIRRVETNSPQASVVKIDGRIESKLKALDPNTQISIIIPTSTQLKYIKNCVKSIKKHTPQSHEIIFVNNGATKGTIKWLKKYIKENSNHHLVKCPKDAGSAVSVNEGIKASTGQYILVLSSDIVVAKGWLSGMLDCMKRVTDAGIIGPMSNISIGLQTVAKADKVSINQLDEFAESFMAGNRYRRISSIGLDGFCLLFRRDLVEEIGFFDEQFGQDGFENEDFCLRAILEGRKNLIAGDVYIHQQNRKPINRSKKYFNTKWSKADTQSPLGKKFLSLTAVEKGNESYQKGHIDNAVEILLEGIELSPNDKRTYYALAEILIHDKKYKDATDVLNEMPPGEQDAKRLELIGYCKEGMKLYDEAHDYANQALSLNPCLATALNLKGILAYNQGDNLAAEDFFNRAIESDPGYGETYTNLGAIRWDKNQEEALNLFEKGFILSPVFPDIVTNYHTAASALGEFERAGQIFKEAGLLYPNNKNIKYKFIDFLLKLEKHAQAISQIEEAIDLFGVDDGILSAALMIRELLGPKEIDKTKDKKSTVSLCMIVKNEEQHLAKCLRSVKPVVDEMIIVDTGSTDRTKDIAKVFGAKIYDCKWNDDFSEARNFSISKASGMWSLILDADEAISSLDHNKFCKIIEESKPVAYQFTTRNYSLLFNTIGWNANDEKYINENAGAGWVPSYKVRLFPNKHGARFEYPIHELIEPSLKKAGIEVKKCKIPIHHYGKLDQKKSDAKDEIYYHIGRKKLDEMGDNAVALCELAIQAGTLGKHEESIELWERLIKIQPGTALAFANMGTAYAKLGKFEKAVSVADKAIKIDPEMKEAHYNYAFAKVHLGQVSEAILVLEKMQNQFSDYPPAQFLLAVAYCLEDRGEKWRESFKKLKIFLGHGLAIACQKFAKRLVSAKRPDYAATLLEAAIESKNNNKEIDELYSKCLEMIDVDKKTGTMGRV